MLSSIKTRIALFGLAAALAFNANAENVAACFEDILWSLLSCSEFAMNH